MVLVTGANGFLGRRLCALLQQEGRTVRVLLRRPEQFARFESQGIEAVQGSLEDTESLARALVGVTELHHLAALANDWAADPRSFYRINFEGSLRLLAAAEKAGVRRTVVASTAATIGPRDPERVALLAEVVAALR